MGTTASLLLLAMGALLHFAARATVPGLDLTLVSAFLVTVGVAGLVLPRLAARGRSGARTGAQAGGRRLRGDRRS
jgi:hypothetical protein